MDFESQLSDLNTEYFFKEFTFSNNLYRDPDGNEFEIGDNLIALDDLLMVFEVKERDAPAHTSPENEEKWYKNKVLKKAVRQIRETTKRLLGDGEIKIKNGRGHEATVRCDSVTSLHKFVVYLPHEDLPQSLRDLKGHISKSCGVIHLLAANDYANLVHYLVTPAEVSEYYRFRENLIQRWGTTINAISEPALLGQYIADEEDSDPSESYIEYLKALKSDMDSWDMSKVLELMPDRIVTTNNHNGYYHILREIAKLMRHELKLFRERFDRSLDAAISDQFEIPFRFFLPRTNCSFVFVPLTKDLFDKRLQAVQNMTLANMYDFKAEKGLGLSFVARDDGGWNIEWCTINQPWLQTDELDRMLQESFPFRDVDEMQVPRYRLDL